MEELEIYCEDNNIKLTYKIISTLPKSGELTAEFKDKILRRTWNSIGDDYWEFREFLKDLKEYYEQTYTKSIKEE